MQQNKIAFVTDDGNAISAHFGRAKFYEVVTVQDQQELQRVRIPKAGHHTFGGQEHHGQEHHGQEHHGHGHERKHETMTAPISDCAVLVARGMGMGAHQHLIAAGIVPILTDELTIDAALEKLKAGTLVDNPRRLHQHGTGKGADNN